MVVSTNWLGNCLLRAGIRVQSHLLLHIKNNLKIIGKTFGNLNYFSYLCIVNKILPHGVMVSTEDSKSFGLCSSQSGATNFNHNE